MRRFRNILVVIDRDRASEALLARAAEIARVNGGSLTLVDALDSSPGELAKIFSALPGARATALEESVLRAHRDRLEEIAEPLRTSGLPVAAEVLLGVDFIETIRHVLRHDIDLVLKDAYQSPDRLSLLSGDLHLLRKCPCPVWILNGVKEPTVRRIMAAVDPDPDDPIRDALNHTVLEVATSLARRDGAKLDVVNAWRLPEESTLRYSRARLPEKEVDALVAERERQSAWRLNALARDFCAYSDLMRLIHAPGAAADVLIDHVANERIDLLVMGTLARTGLAGLFIGNTAETVLSRVDCSVLTVKPRGFVSPVTLEES